MRRLQPVGLQLYTVRSLMEKEFEGTLAAVAELGYREVEFAGYFGKAAGQVRTAVTAAGLSAPSTHVAIADGSKWQATIEAAAEIGCRYLVVPSVPDSMRRTLSDWQRLAERFNIAGEQTMRSGIQFAYHNHEYEFERIDGRVPYDILLAGADPKLVQFEMDIYWVRKGGATALAYFKQWPGRFPLVHVKDMSSSGGMVDVGDGVIDWKAIYEKRREAGIKHWFVEHDDPKDPMGSLRRSYGYMKGLS